MTAAWRRTMPRSVRTVSMSYGADGLASVVTRTGSGVSGPMTDSLTYDYDADGNRYIDFLQAGGPTVLGSNYGPVQERVIALIRECGPVTGLEHPAGSTAPPRPRATPPLTKSRRECGITILLWVRPKSPSFGSSRSSPRL